MDPISNLVASTAQPVVTPTNPPDNTPIVNPLAVQPSAASASPAAYSGPAIQPPPASAGGIDALTGGKPSQPAPPSPAPANGSFGAKLLSAIGGVLSGFGNTVTNVNAAVIDPEKAIERAAAAKKAQAEMAQRQKEEQDRLNQEAIVNKREDDEAHARIAETNVRRMATQKLMYHQDQDFQDKMIAQGIHDRDTFGGEIGGQIIQRGITGDQKNALLQQGKLNGYEYTSFPVGKTTIGTDENGDPIMAFTYDVVKPPDKAPPLSDEQIARIKKVPGYENFQKGVELTGAQAISALSQADVIQNNIEAANKDRQKSKAEKLTAEQEDELAEFNKSTDWSNYLSAHKGSLVGAASAMVSDPVMNKKYPNLFNDVMSHFVTKDDPVGTKLYETMRHDLADEAAKAEEDRLKKASEHSYEGDPTKSGDAFLNTLQPNEKPLVKAAGDGRMKISNLGYLISRNPGFADAVALYAPDFDGSKVESYANAIKEYNDDKPGSVGGTLNAAGTALKTLRRLYDSTNTASLNPLSEEGKKRQTDVDNAAIEVAKFQAGGRQPGKEDIDAIRSVLNPKVLGIANPINRRAAIKEQAELIQKKIQEYEESWHNKAPSPRYQAPMPNVSSSARIDSAYILNGGKYAVPNGATAFVDPKTNHQIFTFDGRAWFDASNGQPISLQGAK